MTLQICVLGIDGSGKSTITASLPAILTGEFGIVAGSAGESFRISGVDEDHLGPDFMPDGLPFLARKAMWLKRTAKRWVDNRKIYPILKIAHMTFQDHSASILADSYGTTAMVSDGNLLLSAMGRAANYRRPASEGVKKEAPTAKDLAAAFAYILKDKALPDDSKARLPSLEDAVRLRRLFQKTGIRAAWLPDVVIFLDLSPKEAVARIGRRGERVDLHENLADLTQARQMYLTTLDALKIYKPKTTVITINVDKRTPGQTLSALVDRLRKQVVAAGKRRHGAVLGTTTGLSERSFWQKVLTFNYMVRYLLMNLHRGSWRELTFIMSEKGRLLLREGYSAGCMRIIYDQDKERQGILDKIFLGYPLHEAVNNRLKILTKEIQPEIESRLRKGKVTIFSAPSGFAYDIFRPLEAIARKNPGLMSKVTFIAADLDPHGALENELRSRASTIGMNFKFFKGDLTKDSFRQKLRKEGPFNMALFVGLSGWLPKPAMIRHLKWLGTVVKKDGVFVTDSFTPHAYSYSGRYVGYKGSYYQPTVFKALVDYAGFDGLRAKLIDGDNGINHVVLARPR
jgi:hypothetical protein